MGAPSTLYALLLILWGDHQIFDFWTALFGSLYLIIGSKFEERSLVSQYGKAYEAYKSSVPAFIPYKGLYNPL